MLLSFFCEIWVNQTVHDIVKLDNLACECGGIAVRYDLHLRQDLKLKVDGLVRELKDWNYETNVHEEDINKLLEYVTHFDHCKYPDRPFSIGGSDSSGGFPVVTYGDSYVYLVTATTRIYEALTEGRLKEMEVPISSLVELLWLPEDHERKVNYFKKFFERICGDTPLEVIINKSDYLQLRKKATGKTFSADELIDKLLFPAAHDANNVRIQVMVAYELCSIISMLNSGIKPTYVILDNTLTLPYIRSDECLFFEVLKRYCCKVALEYDVGLFAISKSHNIPHMEKIEDAISIEGSEHWYFRIPTEDEDGFRPKFLGTRAVPPIGAITYIFKLHKTTQPMRLDMDIEFWNKNIKNEDSEIMKCKENQIFRDLDFTSHDQRCYGYPYPVKASHDIVSLTNAEKEAFRKQVIDAAVRMGLSRRNFIDASIQTGHK